MTNKDRQASLDKQKWLESENEKRDMSGAMYYCGDCTHQICDYCTITHERRVATCVCATAYNRMARKRKSWEVGGGRCEKQLK